MNTPGTPIAAPTKNTTEPTISRTPPARSAVMPSILPSPGTAGIAPAEKRVPSFLHGDQGDGAMRDDEVNAGAMGPVDERAAPAEPDEQGLDVTEEWPQLTPLELAVCLADAGRDPSVPRTSGSR